MEDLQREAGQVRYLVERGPFDSNPCRVHNACFLNPLYELPPRDAWIVSNGVCQEQADFLSTRPRGRCAARPQTTAARTWTERASARVLRAAPRRHQMSAKSTRGAVARSDNDCAHGSSNFVKNSDRNSYRCCVHVAALKIELALSWCVRSRALRSVGQNMYNTRLRPSGAMNEQQAHRACAAGAVQHLVLYLYLSGAEARQPHRAFDQRI